LADAGGRGPLKRLKRSPWLLAPAVGLQRSIRGYAQVRKQIAPRQECVFLREYGITKIKKFEYNNYLPDPTQILHIP
jgi:hypothetical protein